MFPMDRKPMPATVAYTTANGQRKAKQFADAYAARRFYAHQDKLGHTPTVTRSNAMSPETTPEAVAVTATTPAKATSKPQATRKATKAPKAKAKAKPTSKATKAPGKAKAKASKPRAERAPKGPLDLTDGEAAILKVLSSGKDCAKKNLPGASAKVMGANRDNCGVQGGGLAGRGLVKFVEPQGDEHGVWYAITAAGRKAYDRYKAK
jgi:membrane protein involved in colicin uptake